MDLHVLRCPVSENHIFSVLSACPSVCVCYQHNSKTNYSRIFKLGILHLCHRQMLLETFYKDRTKTLCTGAHKRILMHKGLWTKFLISEFSYIQYRLNTLKLLNKKFHPQAVMYMNSFDAPVHRVFVLSLYKVSSSTFI